MKRKLLRQIMNEWRSNLWLAVELMIVSVAVWYLVNNYVLLYRIQHLPNGYDMSSTVSMMYKRIPGVDMPADSAARADMDINAINNLINNIKSRPGVEAVTVGYNIVPYNYNFSGQSIFDAEKPDKRVTSGNMRQGTPEIARVMNLKPLAGAETVEDLEEILSRGELLISRSCGRAYADLAEDDYFGDGLEGAKTLLGKRVLLFGRTYTIGAIVEDMRRGEFEPAGSGSIIYPIKNNGRGRADYNEMVVRVKPGMENALIEDFKANSTKFYRNNLLYVVECKPVEQVRKAHQLENTIEMRNFAIIITFLLVTIFLGLLGTFWFRTTQRVSEIAVRMSTGARSSDIFRRLIGEGMLLLLIGTIPAMVIDWLLASKLNDNWEALDSLFAGGGLGQLALCIGISFVLMALMVIAGIAIPARKAMKIDPATALHAE